MNPQIDGEQSLSSLVETLLSALRAIASVFGIIAVIVGLIYAMKVFGLAYGMLQDPEGFEALLGKWRSAVGGDTLDITLDGEKYPLATLTAILVLSLGAIVLAWVAMGIMLTGAKIISWTAGDREAVKKVLTHAFGPEARARNRRLPDAKDTDSSS